MVMAEVLFYHLERSELFQVLPDLLQKSISRGWRCVVHSGDDQQCDVLDERLWTFRDESFLPHSREDSAEEPILLTVDSDAGGGRDVLFLVDGAARDVASLGEYTRTVLLFADVDAPAARDVWKEVKAASLDATYWRESPNGKWEKAG